MEYIFGKDEQRQSEVLRTKGKTHSDIKGFFEVVNEYPDCTITDSFFVVRKYHSDEDAEGNCYDWYTIDKHNRILDRTPPLKEAEAQMQDKLESHDAQLQQADDTAIELYEANLAQQEINAAQDDALIEIYELIGG